MTQPNPIRTRKLARQQARTRRPVWPALAVGAVLVVGAYAGATAVFSSRAQDITQAFGKGLMGQVNSSGVATLQETGYQKGLTESTQTMLLTVSDESRPLKVLVTNRIKHGPLPGFQGVGQAIIDTGFRFEDAQAQAEFERLFPNEKPGIRTLVGLGGNTDSRVTVPQGQTVADGQTVAWKALGGTVRVSGNRISTDLSWPGLTSSGSEGRLEVAGVGAQGVTVRRSPDDKLGTGDMNFTADRIHFSGGGQEILLGGMKVSSQASEKDNFYDSVVNYTVAQVQAAGMDLKDFRLNLGLRHLDRAALERVLAAVNQMQGDLKRGAQAGRTAPDLTEAQTRELEAAGLALLRGNPRLTLDRLSVRQPGGEVLFRGEASAPRLAQASAEDLQTMAAMPAALLGMFNIHLEGTASKQALQDLANLGGSGASGAAGLSQNLQGLISSGYVRENGDQLTTRLDLQDGQLKLNGQPLGQ